jgi:hypothetical protein
MLIATRRASCTFACKPSVSVTRRHDGSVPVRALGKTLIAIINQLSEHQGA